MKCVPILNALLLGMPIKLSDNYPRLIIKDQNLGFEMVNDNGETVALGGQDINLSWFINECEKITEEEYALVCSHLALNAGK